MDLQIDLSLLERQKSVADLGEGPGGPGPRLILGEKRRNNRRKKSRLGKLNRTKPPP